MSDFGEVLKALKADKGGQLAFQRKGWNGKGMWIAIQYPSPDSDMTLPYICMLTAQDELVPWLASQTDLLADDWQLWEPA